LNDFGKIADDEWEKSAQIRDELELDEFVVMPNHVHGIVIIRSGTDALPRTDARPCVSTRMRKPKSISSFLAGYKSAVTTKIDDWIDLHHADIPKYNRRNRLWQVNYYDHIIRDKGEYNRIKTYIINNPKKWKGDKFYGRNS
jgi:REP element-mobilizing transposase RayT